MNASLKLLNALDSDVRKELVQSYDGEIVGQAMFRVLAEHASTPDDREAYLVLGRVEAGLAALFSPELVEALGVDTADADHRGQQWAAPYLGKPLAAMCAAVLPEAELALQGFHRLQGRTPVELEGITDILVRHETLLVDLFRLHASAPASPTAADSARNVLQALGL